MAQIARSTRILALCLFSLSGIASSGCRVTDTDIRRWESTEQGPDKLVAVLIHDKYDWPLRIDAAAGLTRMKPRSGRRIGIGKMTDAVATLSPDDRKKLVGGLIPILTAEMAKPPTAQQGMAPGENKITDTSIPFKDAAYALLNYDKAELVSDPEHKKLLQDALAAWAVADFDKRIAISAQLYGLEQVFRILGPDGVRKLPPLMTADSTYDKMAALVAELGDAPTKEAASTALVKLAQALESPKWIEQKKPAVVEANKAAGYNPSETALNKQLSDFQEEQIVKVYASMKKVGGRPSTEYLLGVANTKEKPEKRRQGALAALEGRLDRNNPQDIARVMAVAAADDTPDAVRELAFVRASELPREAVAPKLYELFNNKRWKIRWVAAATLLKMSSGKDVPEFISKLPANAAGMAINEPITYGSNIAQMKPAPTKEQMAAELRSASLAAKLVGLGYFYTNGHASDVAAVQALDSDKTALPKVEETEGKWQCNTPKQGGGSELKEVATVGEFVKICVLPAMSARK
jgi:hypothetical protein